MIRARPESSPTVEAARDGRGAGTAGVASPGGFDPHQEVESPPVTDWQLELAGAAFVVALLAIVFALIARRS